MNLLDLLSCSNYRPNMEKYEDKAASRSEVVFGAILNSRNMTEIFVKGKHVSIEDLKEHIEKNSTLWDKIRKLGRRDTSAIESKRFPNKPKILDYLHADMPKYPTPVEFHVSCVAHVTEEGPFEYILQTEKIRPPKSEYSWWSLYIDEEERTSAEERYCLSRKIPHQAEEQRPFLHHFTNSPAFREESRYGSFRFRFPLVDLMELYQEQLCGGEEPVLRVMKTMFYSKEIVYAVLIHSPQYNKKFTELPLLENSEFVRYQDGKMVWHAQAISDCLQRELLATAEGNAEVQHLFRRIFYVWDHVALAFYEPEKGKGLQVPRKRLIEALEACRISERNLSGNMYSDARAAEKRVAELKAELEDKMETENTIKGEPEEDKVNVGE